MYKYEIITSDNAAGFYTVAQLTQDVLLKTLAALPPDDYKTESEVLFHLRQNKMLLAHCKELMAEDKVTSLKAVKNEHH
jgi:hypothetical protein